MSYFLRTLFYNNSRQLLNGCESFNRNNFSNVLLRKDVEVRNLLYRRKYFKYKEKRYWFSKRSIFTRWTPIGLTLYGTFAYYRGINESVSKLELQVYCHLPFRIISKVFGKYANRQVPLNWREFVYSSYAKMFGVNMQEAEETDFKKYNTMVEFFTRTLKEDARIVDKDAVIVSPCDGKILTFGPVTGGQVEQVKGVTYSLQSFIGKNTWGDKNYTGETDEQVIRKYFYEKRVLMQGAREQKTKKTKEKKVVTDEEYYNSVLVHPETNCLYQCVIYLAPGDYHRFHSPCNWIARFRRHFSGKLLSVNPALAKLIPGLFCMNERAVYVGLWKYGFFSYTPVGATNVGSIKIYKDDALHTNGRKRKKCIESVMDPPMDFEKGEMVGQFNMGSTIVLIFEAPKNFQFQLEDGKSVKMGQQIGYFENS